MFGLVALWNAMETLVLLTGHGGDDHRHPPSREEDHVVVVAPSAMPESTAPTLLVAIPTVAPTPAPTSTIKTNSIGAYKSNLPVGPMPTAPVTKPIPTSTTCNGARTAKPGETVFITIDDGPAASGRANILMAMHQLNTARTGPPPVYLTFFESGYNFCGDTTNTISKLQCTPDVFDNATARMVWTVKAGHTLGAHSDTHFYDDGASNCNYIKTNAATVIEDSMTTCGNTIASDFVRGAKHVENALQAANAWSTDADKELLAKAIHDIWSYVRLPCSNAWKLPGGFSFSSGFRAVDTQAERAARLGAADDMFAGTLPCRNPLYQGKPWSSFGWDAEWKLGRGGSVDSSRETCNVVHTIAHAFDQKENRGLNKNAVVVLTHDYFFDTLDKALVLRDVIHELQLLGYSFSTIDKYK
ncbi:hypothetical protein DYB32_007983 [Aphanomyces invadans]|uniref:NodB homology domain-containing protein n=1 Tax=Aphanomyces invadans TaxID=157072 RepID=A0A418AMH6_9STRA|nr:hypothetical protein DYB32_007983 [Aphanomyces invadans]